MYPFLQKFVPRQQEAGCREVLKFSWPIIVNLTSTGIMLFLDRIFLSWHSQTSVQAVIPAGFLCWTIACGLFTIAEYSGVFIAQYYGAKDFRGCGRAANSGLLIACIAAAAIILFIPAGQHILAHFSSSPAVLAEEQLFFRLMMIACSFIPFGVVFEAFFNSVGYSRICMGFSLSRNIVLIILDYCLILGHCGFPALGIRGAGYAAIICYSLGRAGLAVYYFLPRFHQMFHTRLVYQIELKLCWQILRYGVPNAIRSIINFAAYAIFAMLLGKYSDLEQFAGNIVISIQNFGYIVFVALGIGTSILVGRYQGARNPHLALRATFSALKLGAVVTGPLLLVLMLLPGLYLSIFAGHNGATPPLAVLMPIAQPLLLIQGVWTFLSLFEAIGSGSLIGAGDTKFVMLYSGALAFGYFVTGLLLITYVFHGSIIAIWIWCSSYQFLLASGFLWRFLIQRRWQNIQLLKNKTA